MQACQFCGAKSWGPLTEPRLVQLHAQLPAGAQTWVQCDGCGGAAREDLIADFPLAQPSFGSAIPLPFPPPFDPVARASEVLQTLVHKRDPETRLERLVVALLGSETMVNDLMISDERISVPHRLVQRARLIESLLDETL